MISGLQTWRGGQYSRAVEVEEHKQGGGSSMTNIEPMCCFSGLKPGRTKRFLWVDICWPNSAEKADPRPNLHQIQYNK